MIRAEVLRGIAGCVTHFIVRKYIELLPKRRLQKFSRRGAEIKIKIVLLCDLISSALFIDYEQSILSLH